MYMQFSIILGFIYFLLCIYFSGTLEHIVSNILKIKDFLVFRRFSFTGSLLAHWHTFFSVADRFVKNPTRAFFDKTKFGQKWLNLVYVQSFRRNTS